MALQLIDGKLLMRRTKLVSDTRCCCDCCCKNITLNDLLYGDKEYSWPQIGPGGGEPQYGGDTEPPSFVPDEYTAPGTEWVAIGDSCFERTKPISPELAELLELVVGETYKTAGYRVEYVNGGWVEIEKHCFRSIKKVPACLRWVCRCVNNNGSVKCETIYGGPTTTDKNLSELITNTLEPETEAGCFVYTIEFFGWRLRVNDGVDFRSSDDMYSIYKTKITSCP